MSLHTEMTSADLLEYYRSEFSQPHWTLQYEHVEDDAAWTTWSIRDDSDQLWMTVLFAGQLTEGWQKVRFLAITGAEVDVAGWRNPDEFPPVPAESPIPES